LEVVWSRVISVSNYRDGVYSVCASGDRVYAVGFDEYHGLGKKRFRIESFSVKDGKTIAAWTDGRSLPLASFFTCVSYGNRVYAFGATDRFWSMLVFDRMLEVISRVDVDNPHVIPLSSIILDRYPNLYLYVAGTTVPGEGTTAMYVAKVSASDLSIVSSFTADSEGLGAGAYAVAYNNTTKQVVVGGYAKAESGLEWLVTFHNEDLKLDKVVKPGIRGSISGLAVDANGFIYAVDGKRVVKMDPEGKVVASVELPQAMKIYASQDRASPISAYVAVASDSELYLLSSENLSPVSSARLAGEPQMLIAFPGSMDAVYDSIYLAVTQVASNEKWNWVVMALTPRPTRARRFPRIFPVR